MLRRKAHVPFIRNSSQVGDTGQHFLHTSTTHCLPHHTFHPPGPQEVAALLKQLTKSALASDPSALGALIQAAPSSSSSSSGNHISRLLIRNALNVSLSSLSPGEEAPPMPSAEGNVVSHGASADALSLAQGIIRTNSSTNLAASQPGSVMAAAAAAETFPSGRSMMELLHEALGSSSGNAVARPGGFGSGARILGAPRADTGLCLSPGFAGPSAGVRSGGITRTGSGLLVGDERFMGSRAERWQAALLTSANASRKSRDAEARAEGRKKKKAARGGGDSEGQSSGHVMFSAKGMHHSNEEEPDCGIEGWEEGDVVLPGSGSGCGRPSRAPNVPLSGACHIVDSLVAGGGMSVDGSMASGGSVVAEGRMHAEGMTAGNRVAAGDDTAAEGGAAVAGSAGTEGPAAASSSELPKSLQAVHLASSSIAILAAQRQAAYLVAMLAGNQQLLSDVRAEDASAHSSLTSGSGGQRPTGSDHISRMSDMPSSTTRRPSGSQRDDASRRLSAILVEMRSEAEGLGSGSGTMRQRRRSDVVLASTAGSGARLMGPPPAPDELAAAASSVDIGVSGSSDVRSSPAAPRWKNIFKVERRPFRPFCQPSSSGPLYRVPAPDDHDAQSIAEEASN